MEYYIDVRTNRLYIYFHMEFKNLMLNDTSCITKITKV